MDFYQIHDVTIQTGIFGRIRAEEILKSHERRGDIDRYYIAHKEKDSDGIMTIRYRIAPIIYEDFEKIVDEFNQNGIWVI